MSAESKDTIQDSSQTGVTSQEAVNTAPSQPAPKTEDSTTDSKSAPSNAPLAPPPKPSQQNGGDSQGDYFGGAANGGSHFSLEPNPFEQSFGNPSSAETPSKFGGLPSVASLTSPAPLGATNTPGWQGSLRSGHLSPAMLSGPTNQNGGYFDQEFRGSFPTPNESSLRTGLTPGGGGSMFPAPSPNSQAILTQFQNGGATPGTLDFQRSAMSAAARSKSNNTATSNNQAGMMGGNQGINKQEYQPAQQQSHTGPQDPFNSSHPESDAVNSLYMLANNNRNANQFAQQTQLQQQRMANHNQTASQHQAGKQSIGSGDAESYDGEANSPDNKQGRGRGAKKGGKASQATNGRRKAEDTPAKTPANKRQKANDPGEDDDDMDDDDDGEGMDDMPSMNSSGKKMTDEEKRKNFLERNRIAALKCRQRKKQWLANLQTKVEIFTTENDALTAQCTQLREEIVNLKTLLLAHKDCPVSHSQGLGGNAMAQVIGDFNPHQNPYGLQMPNGQGMMGMQGQGVQRS